MPYQKKKKKKSLNSCHIIKYVLENTMCKKDWKLLKVSHIPPIPCILFPSLLFPRAGCQVLISLFLKDALKYAASSMA